MTTQMRSGKDANEATALQDVSGSPRNHGRAVKRTPGCTGMFTSDPVLHLQPLLPPNTDRTSGKGKQNHSVNPCHPTPQLYRLSVWRTMTHIPSLLNDPYPFVSRRGDGKASELFKGLCVSVQCTGIEFTFQNSFKLGRALKGFGKSRETKGVWARMRVECGSKSMATLTMG